MGTNKIFNIEKSILEEYYIKQNLYVKDIAKIIKCSISTIETNLKKFNIKKSGIKTKETRFWAKVNKDGPISEYCPELGKCWIWKAGTTTHGYGCFGINGKIEKAHRISFQWIKGNIPKDKILLHICNNKLCINPIHLKIGTYKENTQDSIKVGTAKFLNSKGENNDNVKLSNNDVLEIRKLYKKGDKKFNSKSLSKIFNVSQAHILRVVNNKSWQHI